MSSRARPGGSPRDRSARAPASSCSGASSRPRLFAAVVDLGAAARTDPELRRALGPVERRLNRETLVLCRTIFAGDPESSSLDPTIAMALSTIRGLAILPLLSTTGRRDANANWKHSRERLVELLDPAVADAEGA